MTELAQIRQALIAASLTADPALRTLYVAAARVVAERIRHELGEIERVIAVAEADLRGAKSIPRTTR